MLSYCLKCGKKAESKNLKFAKTKKGKPILLSKCVKRDSKNSRFIRKQEASGLLTSSLGVKLTFERIPVLGSNI